MANALTIGYRLDKITLTDSGIPTYGINISYPNFSFVGKSGGILTVGYPKVDLSLASTLRSQGSFGFTLPKYSFKLHTGARTNGTLDITYPKIDISFTGNSDVNGSFALEFPPFSLRFGTGRITSTGTGEYRTLVMETDNILMPMEYTNFGFNSIIVYNSNVYLSNSSGLYLLGGTTDDGSNIDAYFQTHDYDFKSNKLKTVLETNVGVKGGPVSVASAHDSTLNSARDTISSTGFRTKRVKHPKGLKQRYWGVRIDNVQGSSFEIDGLEVVYKEHLRRINQK